MTTNRAHRTTPQRPARRGRVRRVAAAPAAAVLALGLAACGVEGTVEDPTPEPDPTDVEPEPTDEPDPGGPSLDGPTLREATPAGLVIGNVAAGGGHHGNADYPEPFPNDEGYRTLLAAQFSSLTPENQLKWDHVRPNQDTFDFGPADAVVDFAEEHGMQVRGHTLMWHSQNPGWLEDGDFTDDELRDILREHIETVVGRYAGRIHQWDVANEIFDDSAELRDSENIWIARLGVEIVADAFRWAHEADPDALLFVNDYNVDGVNAKSTAYYELVQELLDDGVPVHGFGAQGHLATQYGFPGDLEQNLQRFGELGLHTAITELDVRIVLDADGGVGESDLAQQAEYYERALDACLAVSSCTSFTLWGTSDAHSWIPGVFDGEGAAHIFDEDFQPKPAFEALRETLLAASS